MPATTRYALPYPAPADPADVPADMQELADAVDAALLPADTVAAAATRVIANLLAAGNTQPAFRIMGDGKHEWGAGGSTVPDVNLYRSGATELKTDNYFKTVGAITVTRPAGQASALIVTAAGTTNNLLRLRADPGAGLEFADGAGGAFDVQLYRSGPGTLKSNGGLRATTGFYVDVATASPAYRALQAATGVLLNNFLAGGDANSSFQLRGDGRMDWGAGGASVMDVNLARISASGVAGLAVNGMFRIGSYTTATRPVASSVGAGTLIYVSDGAAGAKFQGSDGTNWVNLG